LHVEEILEIPRCGICIADRTVHSNLEQPVGMFMFTVHVFRGADNSLARPGRKQAIATEDFDVHISYL